MIVPQFERLPNRQVVAEPIRSGIIGYFKANDQILVEWLFWWLAQHLSE